jgi:hypothetical protein
MSMTTAESVLSYIDCLSPQEQQVLQYLLIQNHQITEGVKAAKANQEHDYIHPVDHQTLSSSMVRLQDHWRNKGYTLMLELHQNEEHKAYLQFRITWTQHSS